MYMHRQFHTSSSHSLLKTTNTPANFTNLLKMKYALTFHHFALACSYPLHLPPTAHP